ncbi:HPP family protein [Thermoactinomyces sp. CICC 10521]|uniref:HPP family protein n=1 Tax=Thermoactinomyces sp. CICC 10521 TaxID=2767426 RepID=UPI0018DE835F|nr:HPP family protein [Thermoactinomyces sp. CICC 10521]MBH8609386.1 HPP family protein [Thermoactinomyces sp. CICC 10521]
MNLRFISKLKTDARTPLKVVPTNVILGFIGGFITIFSLAYLTEWSKITWLMAPFGASCVLAFAVWDAPLSQPRNIIGGHFLSTLVGILCLKIFGNHPWVIALGVGLAISLMVLTKTTHPPAGADPIVVILGNFSWNYLISPVLIGSVVVVVLAILVNNFTSKRKYPSFWL